jgi:hypothetical protein
VGLVDDDQTDRQRRERGEAVDVIEVLRRDEQQLDVPTRRRVAGRRVLLVGLVAVDAARGQAEPLVEVAELVAHQREQRRDDQGDPAEQRGRQLIQQALAVAGRLNAQQAAAGQQRLDAVALPGAELGEPEALQEHAIDVGGGELHARAVTPIGISRWPAARWMC